MTWQGADVLLSLTYNREIWKQLRAVSNPLGEQQLETLVCKVHRGLVLYDIALLFAFTALLVINFVAIALFCFATF